MGIFSIKDCIEEIYKQKGYHQDFSYHIKGCRKNSIEASVLSLIAYGNFLNDYLTKYFANLDAEIHLSDNPDQVIKSHEDELKMIKSKLLHLREELTSLLNLDKNKEEDFKDMIDEKESPRLSGFVAMIQHYINNNKNF